MLIEKSDISDVSNILKILSNENRLLIVCLLIEEPLKVSEIHESISNLTQPALSQHLAVLKANRILASKKEGLNIIYYIKDEKIEKLIRALKEIYCNN
ncbi:MAG: ArsR/SmtB family transcription factor [Sarcina sp.]